MCGEGSARWETWEIKESRTGRVINSYTYIVHMNFAEEKLMFMNLF